MKAMIQVGAFAPYSTPSDPDYETRCINLDAERAARMGEKPEKACSWARGTAQHELWMRVYQSSQRAAA